ncbi:MAG: deoxyribonuclease IV [bacterium]|nr:deoxyribonuclease IV [bacterium]
MPLIGAHVSIAGGMENAPVSAGAEGCECFQMFTRSPRGGAAPPLTDAIVRQFRDACAQHGFSTWVVHTPYYINLASERPVVRAAGSRIIREELERASALGARYVMTHLGSTKAVGEERGVQLAIEGIADALSGYTGSAEFLIEIAAGAGAVLGDTFEEIATIIAGAESLSFRPSPRAEKSRSAEEISRLEDSLEMTKGIGVCFDTQHAFASGYDLRTTADVDRVLREFDATIGLDRLCMSHVQDSKVEIGANRDRHEHVGDGAIGADGLRAFVRHPAIADLPLILETQPEKRARDIAMLKAFRDA